MNGPTSNTATWTKDFVDQCLDRTAPEIVTSARLVYRVYEFWCQITKRTTVNKHDFKDALEQAGFQFVEGMMDGRPTLMIAGAAMRRAMVLVFVGSPEYQASIPVIDRNV